MKSSNLRVHVDEKKLEKLVFLRSHFNVSVSAIVNMCIDKYLEDLIIVLLDK